MIKNSGTDGAGGVAPVYIANGGAGCEPGSGVSTPGSGGSGGNGKFIWHRTEDGSVMRFWRGVVNGLNEASAEREKHTPQACCLKHNLRLIQDHGTEIYHKCYVCGRDWTEPAPVNPMETVKINPMPTKWENGKKKPPIPEGAMIVHL